MANIAMTYLAKISVTIAIMALVIGIVFMAHAHAEIQTDKTNYDAGQIITITGHEPIIQVSPVILKIQDVDNNLVTLFQLKLDGNQNFQKTVIIDGPLWLNGTYTISEQYGNSTSYAFFDLGTSASLAISKSTIAEPITPTFSESNATQPIFSDSNATNPTLSFGQSNATDTAIITTVAAQPANSIPTWVKGIFAFWQEGKISDTELVNALQFLIKSGIINIS